MFDPPKSFLLFFCARLEVLCDDLALIHVMLFPAYDLIVLMAFARKDNNITRHVIVNSICNGLGAVFDNGMRCVGAFHAGDYLFYYLVWILGTGVVGGDDHKIWRP